MPGTSRPYVLQQQIGFALRLVFQHHTAIFTARMVGELTQPQFAALWTLRAIGRCSQNNLGRLTALDSATIKGVVTRLQQRGLMRAAADAADRRRLVLTVTKAGATLLDEAEPVARAITDTTLFELRPEEREQLLTLLAKICAPASPAIVPRPLRPPPPSRSSRAKKVVVPRPATPARPTVNPGRR